MREDICGIFWDDTPPPRVVKAPPPVRVPPPRTWEEPGYLPYLDEALRFDVELFTGETLLAAQQAGEPLLFDSEVYGNYYLAAFKGAWSGRVLTLEVKEGGELEVSRLNWILSNFVIVGFNLFYFDLPIVALACAGLPPSALKVAVDDIIKRDIKPWMVLRSHKVKRMAIDAIDLIEVAPLTASLKIYGGRLHAPRLQELPFPPDTILSDEQIAIVRWYCVGSDLVNTGCLFKDLLPQIELRKSMSVMYGVDLRSKSDAQIAEAVLVAELTRLTYSKPVRPEIPPGTSFRYRLPDFIRYDRPELAHVLPAVTGADFIVTENGSSAMPPNIAELKIELDGATYKMGIGGLHSGEGTGAHLSDDDFVMLDADVTSYYPSIILNLGLFPQHLGPQFLDVYRSLVARRVAAKQAGNKMEAATLKIVVNGSFGKLGSKWSALYAPDLMVQVTLTGQLALLMLVERITIAGIKVCSANTDGVLVRCPRGREAEFMAVVHQWERDTGFLTEQTRYLGVFARDVNNYIGVTEERKTKVKGAYAERGSAGDSVLSKNPVNLICHDAVIAFLTEGVPLRQTIRGCTDIRRFITVRTVKGGAVKDGVYLGKAIRWFWSTTAGGEIIYAETGHKVPDSDGARPAMDLPAALPDDLDFDRYEAEALRHLVDIGVSMEVA